MDHLSLKIESGSFIAVLGHNGSGKSTFAKHINALLTPTDGTLWVNGMDTKDEEHLWISARMLEWYFRIRITRSLERLWRKMWDSDPENLGVPTDEIWTRVEESLDAVGMLKYRHHSPNKLSGGPEAAGSHCRCDGYASEMHRHG